MIESQAFVAKDEVLVTALGMILLMIVITTVNVNLVQGSVAVLDTVTTRQKSVTTVVEVLILIRIENIASAKKSTALEGEAALNTVTRIPTKKKPLFEANEM